MPNLPFWYSCWVSPPNGCHVHRAEMQDGSRWMHNIHPCINSSNLLHSSVSLLACSSRRRANLDAHLFHFPALPSRRSLRSDSQTLHRRLQIGSVASPWSDPPSHFHSASFFSGDVWPRFGSELVKQALAAFSRRQGCGGMSQSDHGCHGRNREDDQGRQGLGIAQHIQSRSHVRCFSSTRSEWHCSLSAFGKMVDDNCDCFYYTSAVFFTPCVKLFLEFSDVLLSSMNFANWSVNLILRFLLDFFRALGLIGHGTFRPVFLLFVDRVDFA